LDDEIRSLVINRESTSEIRNAAQKNGMQLLRQNGWEKIRQGITTLEEVLKETQGYF
jgi:type II secretory ATPase GspE/PulE/Tfp pilus assembly ATPase PilB-like protein